VVAPERVEGLIERHQLIPPLHEQRTARMEHFISHVEIDVRECLGEIEDASDWDFKADASQQAPEDDEVFYETPDCQLPTPNG
jgi:hypothetical protein